MVLRLMGLKRGFTVIDLTIVLLVIGIFFAIVIPNYCDYRGRAKVAKAMSLVAEAKLYLTELQMKKVPLPKQNDLQLMALIKKDDTIETVTWFPEQLSLLVALSSEATKDTKEAGKYFVLTMQSTQGNIIWKCSNKHRLISEKPVLDQDLPRSCRS